MQQQNIKQTKNFMNYLYICGNRLLLDLPQTDRKSLKLTQINLIIFITQVNYSN